MSNVIISADSTCDIGPALQKKYDVRFINWKIELEDKEYLDSVEIFPEDLYKAWRERKALPKSAGGNPHDYIKHFTPLLENGNEVVHLSLGSGISYAHRNSLIAAQELGNVHVVDSQNLSSGTGLLVLQAAELAKQGLSASEIQKAVQNMCRRSHASFLLDTLEFMKAGGRCSTLAVLGANLLSLKPCIEVNNQDGSRMSVGKKYRGKMENCLRSYVKDKLENRDDLDLEHVFITHSGAPESDIEAVREEILRFQKFKNIHVTHANCVISTHCGPGTLGVLFMTKE